MGVDAGRSWTDRPTKHDLVAAALAEHARQLGVITAELERLPDPRERLEALVRGWVEQRTARYGCRTGTLAAELDKCGVGGLDAEAGKVIRLLMGWVERQFGERGLSGPDGAALTLVGAYQGMSLLANALRGAEVMAREGARLTDWLDSLQEPPGATCRRTPPPAPRRCPTSPR
ncbi:TetR/AcrR family transcriptional regulator [Streptomyces sp. NPDC050759]|uniref:TetR/AcrR family transcriptional regulator n=1 Tax=Streptomyces sp. NPDC050759 TaxID=3365635 RepID=UPI0037B7262A